MQEKKRNKRLRIFYELASTTTRNCSKLLDEVKQKLYVKLVTCILKSNDEFKSNIKKCRKVFKLDSLRFEERFLRSDKEESFLVGRLLAKKLQVSKSQSSSSGIDSQAQLGKLNEGKNGQIDELVMDEEHAWKDLHNEYSECSIANELEAGQSQSSSSSRDSPAIVGKFEEGNKKRIDELVVDEDHAWKDLHNEYSECSISNELEADQSQSSSSSTDCPKRLGDLGQGKKRRTNGLEEDERSTEKNLRTECPDCFIPSKSQPGKSQASSSSTDCPKRPGKLGQGLKRRRDGFEEFEGNAEKKVRSECVERSTPGKSKAGQRLSSSLITDCLKQLDRLRQGGRKRQRDESADDEKLKRKKISKECNILSESYVGQSESSSCDTSYPIRLEVNRKITRVNSLQLHSQCSGLNKLQICTSTDCLRIGSLGRGRKRNSCEFAAEDEIKKMFQTNAVDVLHNECPSIECESKKRKLTTNERSGNNDAAITMPPVMSELHSVSNVMQEESGNLQRKFNENGMPKDQQHSYRNELETANI